MKGFRPSRGPTGTPPGRWTTSRPPSGRAPLRSPSISWLTLGAACPGTGGGGGPLPIRNIFKPNPPSRILVPPLTNLPSAFLKPKKLQLLVESPPHDLLRMIKDSPGHLVQPAPLPASGNSEIRCASVGGGGGV